MKIIPSLVATLHCLLQLQHVVHSLWSPIFTDPEKVKKMSTTEQSPAGLDHAGPGHLVHEVDQLHRLVLLLLLAHPFERARTRFFFAASHRVDLNGSQSKWEIIITCACSYHLIYLVSVLLKGLFTNFFSIVQISYFG